MDHRISVEAHYLCGTTATSTCVEVCARARVGEHARARVGERARARVGERARPAEHAHEHQKSTNTNVALPATKALTHARGPPWLLSRLPSRRLSTIVRLGSPFYRS